MYFLLRCISKLFYLVFFIPIYWNKISGPIRKKKKKKKKSERWIGERNKDGSGPSKGTLIHNTGRQRLHQSLLLTPHSSHICAFLLCGCVGPALAKIPSFFQFSKSPQKTFQWKLLQPSRRREEDLRVPPRPKLIAKEKLLQAVECLG